MIGDPYASDVEIERLTHRVLDQSLPKAEWTHAAHFASVLWLLRHRPNLVLSKELPAIIRRYNEVVGRANTDTEGYHETITQASLGACELYLANCLREEPLHAVLGALMRSPLGRSDWLLAHWSKERLFSAEARRAWVAPDIKPL